MMFLVAAAVGLGGFLVRRYLETHRPYGGFATFGEVARHAGLLRATSIGVFIPGDDE